MDDDQNAEDFTLDDGRLECPRDMSAASPLQFRDYCTRLVETSESEDLLIDLTGTKFLPSHHIGVIAHLWVEAMAQKKKLQVRVSDDLKRTFSASGLDEVIGIKT